MNLNYRILTLSLVTAFFWQPAYADRTYSNRVLRCESQNNSYQFCPVRKAKARYLSLSRQISKSSCVEGRSYGINRRGVWVDRGCRADFTISNVRHSYDEYGNPAFYGTHPSNHDGYERGYYDRPPRRPHWEYRPYPRQGPRKHPRSEYYDRSYDVPRASSRGGGHFRVGQRLDSGRSWVGPQIRQRQVHTIRVLLRRLDPAQTDTHVSVGYSDYHQLGAQQVDSQNLHWLTFQAGHNWTKGRKIVVTSHSGTVYVDRVVVD